MIGRCPMPDRCTDPTCLEHWPKQSDTINGSAQQYLTLHTAPPPVTERSTGYPRRDFHSPLEGGAALTFLPPLTADPLNDGDDDE